MAALRSKIAQLEMNQQIELRQRDAGLAQKMELMKMQAALESERRDRQTREMAQKMENERRDRQTKEMGQKMENERRDRQTRELEQKIELMKVQAMLENEKRDRRAELKEATRDQRQRE
jgi:hypothetical protein